MGNGRVAGSLAVVATTAATTPGATATAGTVVAVIVVGGGRVLEEDRAAATKLTISANSTRLSSLLAKAATEVAAAAETVEFLVGSGARVDSEAAGATEPAAVK